MATSNIAIEMATESNNRVYKKVAWRLVPFLCLCYLAAYLDRVNVGFAKLQMLSDLSFSNTVYGLGAGIFFLGYVIFEVPSNILMYKVGAKLWIARIMISWGLIGGAMAFVQTPTQFYLLRFLLSVSDPLYIGWLTTIPYSVAIVAMVLNNASADRHRERRWHAAIPCLFTAAGLALCATPDYGLVIAMMALTLAAAGASTAQASFWSLPSTFLTGAAAAAGSALVNSLGNIAGMASTSLVGWLTDLTGSPSQFIFVCCFAGRGSAHRIAPARFGG